MYRALANLTTGKGLIQRGQAFSKRKMAQVTADKLLEMGKIVEVNAPPLSAIPEMKAHCRKLKRVSITQADAFVDADPLELVQVLDLDERQIILLQDKICRALDAPQPGVKG